jgi:Flp pilus assembly protein TadD/ADP-heptose:LPS heptosyltransferase
MGQPSPAKLLRQAQAVFHAGDRDRARAICEFLLRHHQEPAGALHLLAAIAASQERYSEAEQLMRKALRLDRASPYFYNSLGNILRFLCRTDEAIAAYRHALRLQPGMTPARLGLAQALADAGDPGKALDQVRQTLRIKPDLADGYAIFGLILAQEARYEEAMEQYERAVGFDPRSRAAQVGYALLLLRAGELARGWHHYLLSLPGSRPPDPAEGNAVFKGRRLFVYGEQGVGDEILSASCYPELLAEAAECTFACEPRLKPLFERSFPSGRHVPLVRERRTIRVAQRPDEVHLTSDFVPAYLRRDFAGFPARTSYLLPDPTLQKQWRTKLRSTSPGPWVGISWRGGATPDQKRARTIPLERWEPVVRVPGVNFVSLQYGDVVQELNALKRKTGIAVHRWTDPDPLKDLDGFAALVSALDLVISESNTTVHVSGALGVPTWTLVPFVPIWHWFLDRADSPWYPGMRLFRQQTMGDWGSVLREVGEELRAMAEESPKLPAD